MLRRQERHVWETQNIFRVFEGAAPLPLPGGWAASTDLLGEVLRAVNTRRPKLVVELGAGVSTLVIAAALRANGAGRLISVDAEQGYAAITREQLQRHALAQWAEIRFAALKDMSFEGVTRPWYDTAVLADLKDIDVLLIDGPPTLLRPDIRYPALPLLSGALSPVVTAVLDDLVVPDMQKVLRLWLDAYPDFGSEILPLEKQAAVLRRS